MFGCGVFACIWARLTIRSPFGKGSGRNSTELIAEKTALLAPIPNASVSTTVIENAGAFVNARTRHLHVPQCRIQSLGDIHISCPFYLRGAGQAACSMRCSAR